MTACTLNAFFATLAGMGLTITAKRCWARRWLIVSALMLGWGMGPALAQAPATDRNIIVSLSLDGAVSPASADHIVRGIEEAERLGAQAVLLQIDTPGGLSSAMRGIIKAVLASPVPVIGYVSPQGARAASAGTYILYASHIAAMAPATNIGAATPVPLMGSGGKLPTQDKDDPVHGGHSESAEMRKITNDAVAYIRALAEQHGRNADWAEQAVREAVSISAEQALKTEVIDLVAPNVPALLAALNERTVETAAGTRTLHTTDDQLQSIQPGFRSQFLSVIANPTVALILLLLGLGGLVLEGSHPGGILPGVVGAISLLLALYAFQLLPVNFAGLALMLLGAVLIIAEAFVPAVGILAGGGVVAIVAGAVILMRTGTPAFDIALPTIIGIALAGAGVLVGIIWMAIRSHHHPVVSGSEEMIGTLAVVVDDFHGHGLVHVHGEHWQAESAGPLQKGQKVRVLARHGLVLQVQPAPSEKDSS